MKSITKLLKIFLLTSALGGAASAWAWDGSLTGTVQSYDVVVGQTGNFDFRVVLSGSPILCTGGTNWAYANSNEPNYNTLVASIISAKSTGQSVRLYTTRDAYNYCHIGYAVIN